MIGKGRAEQLLPSPADKSIRCFRSPQIGIKKTPPFIQGFSMVQFNPAALFTPQPRFYHTGHILSEVQNKFSFFRNQRLLCLDALCNTYRFIFLRGQNLFCIFILYTGQCRRRAERMINYLSVINVTISFFSCSVQPGFICHYRFSASILITQQDLGNQRGPFPIMVSFSVKPKNTLVPTVADRNLQQIAPSLLRGAFRVVS